MKGIKQIRVQSFRNEESSSGQSSQEDNGQSIVEQQNHAQSQAQQSEIPRNQSQPQSQFRSSDYVSNQLVYDPQVGYDTGNYKMQKIKGRRWNLQKRCFQYLIKWRGYRDNQCTWQTTQDILRQPCLQLKDLGKKSLLANFQRTHVKTIIYDELLKKNVRTYFHTEKNHMKFASKSLIEEMDREMRQIYGEEKQQKLQSKIENETNPVKIQTEKPVNEPTLSDKPVIKSLFGTKEFQVKNLTIQKLIYFPLQFELKILVRQNYEPFAKKILTCSQMMAFHPETGVMCYKAKLAMIQKWKRQNLPRT